MSSLPQLAALEIEALAMSASWRANEPALHDLVARDGLRRAQLINLVQELYSRAATSGVGAFVLLRERLGSPYVVVLRHIFEATATLQYLAAKTPELRIREAGIAIAHDCYRTRIAIEANEIPDPTGEYLRSVGNALHRLAQSVPPEALREAERRATKFSWTGMSMHQLLQISGTPELQRLYGGLSNIGHAQNTMSQWYLTDMTEERVENTAVHCRHLLSVVRNHVGYILGMPFPP